MVRARLRDHVAGMLGPDLGRADAHRLHDQRSQDSPATTATASRMPATSSSPRSSASAARPFEHGQRQQAHDVVGRQGLRGLQRQAVHEHGVGLVRSAPLEQRGRDRERTARRGRAAATTESASAAASVQHLERPRRRPRRRRRSAPPARCSSRARRSPNAACASAQARTRSGASTLLVLGAGEQRAGPAHADAAHPRRPLHGAHALELRREAGNEREHARRRPGCAPRSARRCGRPRRAPSSAARRSRRRCGRRGRGRRRRSGRSRSRRRTARTRPRRRARSGSTSNVSEHLGARAVDVAVEVRDVGAGDAGRRDRAGNQGSVGSSTSSSSARAPSTSPSCSRAAASRKSPRSGRAAFSRTISAHASTSHGRCELEQEPGDERRGRRPHRGVGRAAARELEAVERLFFAEVREELAGRGRTLRSPKALRSTLALDRGRSSVVRRGHPFDRHPAPTSEDT